MNNRITQGRELLLAGDIDSSDYLRSRVTPKKTTVLEAKLSDIPLNLMVLSDVEAIPDKAIDKIVQLDAIFCNSDVSTQREVIGSMFPEKFTFESLKDRTAKVSFLFQLMY